MHGSLERTPIHNFIAPCTKQVFSETIVSTNFLKHEAKERLMADQKESSTRVRSITREIAYRIGIKEQNSNYLHPKNPTMATSPQLEVTRLLPGHLLKRWTQVRCSGLDRAPRRTRLPKQHPEHLHKTRMVEPSVPELAL